MIDSFVSIKMEVSVKKCCPGSEMVDIVSA